jgi:hypothetical protein
MFSEQKIKPPEGGYYFLFNRFAAFVDHGLQCTFYCVAAVPAVEIIINCSFNNVNWNIVDFH